MNYWKTLDKISGLSRNYCNCINYISPNVAYDKIITNYDVRITMIWEKKIIFSSYNNNAIIVTNYYNY